MLEVKGLPKYIKSPQVKEILSNHVNEVLKKCVVFIGYLTEEVNKKDTLLSKWQRKQMRRRLCSSRIRTDKDRVKIILSLLRKLYSEEVEQLTPEEKFVLCRVCYSAIEREEDVISQLVISEDLRLENWMWGRYMIVDTDERRKVLKHLRKMKVGAKEYPKHILEDKTIQERERILDAVGQTNMLLFEYPTVINLVFDEKEYNILVSLVKNEEEKRA